MKYISILLLSLVFSAKAQKPEIEKLLNDWHKAAADVKFDAYFGAFTKDAVYIGTDAAENWKVDAFKAWAKPYFDKGTTWNFKAVERNIFISADGKFAWFDELLDTQMKLCRGSGVLRKEDGKWKIAHYVLSMTVPNDNLEEVVAAKQKIEDAYLQNVKSKK
ncbi:nuclear transport factor 2 family protein [Flavobacterium selenitireducens]|uniref:nuclear transport factor 2 family protein n=1 Tax=Flavobacterium selenitireducens TaxID=2722704 RepID=UPI00168AB15C|nr:nuclear transport factor 2 family protein [Flavobacterium selenitireducens]